MTGRCSSDPDADGERPVSGESACEACLRRAALLAALAGYIENAARRGPRQRARELLSLSDAELAAAVDAPAEALAGLDPRPGSTDALSTCRHRPSYPAALHDLGAAAPHALWARGAAAALEQLNSSPAVAIVGSRRATGYGREVAYELGLLLASAGLVVVSGLAHGIDAAAHRGALDASGTTVAVLGSGADVAYPAGQSALYRRIAAEGGLLLSEMPPGFRPFRWSFPARNRTMAALGMATVVVEAAERSGSLITVRLAQSLGREVGAVPGPINSRFSRGSNALIADGAFPVLGAESVLDELFGPGARKAGPVNAPPAELASLLERVEAGDATPDDIAAATGSSAAGVAAGLARLELLGHVRVDATGRYIAAASL